MKKLSRQEAIALLHTYLQHELVRLPWFKPIRPFIKAIVFYGSTTKGLHKPTSDLDILIFVPLAIETKYTAGEYVYLFKDRTINIVLRSIERLRKLKEHSDALESEVFRDCELLFESDSEARVLIAKIMVAHTRKNAEA